MGIDKFNVYNKILLFCRGLQALIKYLNELGFIVLARKPSMILCDRRMIKCFADK